MQAERDAEAPIPVLPQAMPAIIAQVAGVARTPTRAKRGVSFPIRQEHPPRHGGAKEGPGRMAGELKWVHNMAIDSKGNLYTVEVGTGRRAQKFKRVE
jgi:hypothetical protein